MPDLHMAVVRREACPTDWPEKSDGVVFYAVALPVAGDQFLMLSPGGVALRTIAWFAQQGIESGADRGAVLPRERFAKGIGAGDLADGVSGFPPGLCELFLKGCGAGFNQRLCGVDRFEKPTRNSFCHPPRHFSLLPFVILTITLLPPPQFFPP